MPTEPKKDEELDVIMEQEKELVHAFYEEPLGIWERRDHFLAKKWSEEVLSERELVTHSQMLMSQIVRRANLYLACIDQRIAKGDGKLAYEMIKLIFALVPRETREQLIALSPDDAKAIIDSAVKAIHSSTPDLHFQSELKKKES